MGHREESAWSVEPPAPLGRQLTDSEQGRSHLAVEAQLAVPHAFREAEELRLRLLLLEGPLVVPQHLGEDQGAGGWMGGKDPDMSASSSEGTPRLTAYLNADGPLIHPGHRGAARSTTHLALRGNALERRGGPGHDGGPGWQGGEGPHRRRGEDGQRAGAHPRDPTPPHRGPGRLSVGDGLSDGGVGSEGVSQCR